MKMLNAVDLFASYFLALRFCICMGGGIGSFACLMHFQMNFGKFSSEICYGKKCEFPVTIVRFWFLVWLNLVRIRFGKEMADFEKTWENSNTTKRNRKKERTLKIA